MSKDSREREERDRCKASEYRGGIECEPLDDLYGITAARNEERARCIGIVTALWGADLVTTQAALSGEVTLDEAMRRWRGGELNRWVASR